MKNLIFFLLFLLPQLSFSQGQCSFSAQVYSQDPCCIIVDAGCEEKDAWRVVVDGTTSYDYTDYDPNLGNTEFLVCYDENGSHTVEFFVNGVLWWTRVVEITDCEDPDPGQCHFSAQVYSQDPCCIIVDAACENEEAWTVVVDGTTTYDYTDYDSSLGNTEFLVCYDENGSHTLEFFVNGVLWWTRVVEITDCEDPDPGQCYFSAQVYSQDPCCIIVDASCENENAWTVVVDGTTTYDYTDYDSSLGNTEFLVCYEKNGVHSVEFFVNGVLWWTRIVEITECRDVNPGQCYFSAQVYSKDPCCIIVDAGCDEDCAWTVVVDGTTTYDHTDYDPNLGNSEFLLCYEENGTHTVDFYVNGDLWWTRDVEITDCGKDPCCDVAISNIDYIFNPFNPCQIFISYDTRVEGGEECLEGAVTTYDYGDGSSGTSKFHTYSGAGPWIVCVTITVGDCEYTACETFNLEGCGRSDGGRSNNFGTGSKFDKEVSLFPNPTTGSVNLTIDQNMTNPPNRLELRDVSGKLVYQQELSDRSNSTIDLSTLPSGLYIVQLSNQNGLIATERLVKQ